MKHYKVSINQPSKRMWTDFWKRTQQLQPLGPRSCRNYRCSILDVKTQNVSLSKYILGSNPSIVISIDRKNVYRMTNHYQLCLKILSQIPFYLGRKLPVLHAHFTRLKEKETHAHTSPPSSRPYYQQSHHFLTHFFSQKNISTFWPS